MTRLRLAWSVLRGRPTMYRILVHDGSVVLMPGGSIAESIVQFARVGVIVLPSVDAALRRKAG